jgi:hypothetical protein
LGIDVIPCLKHIPANGLGDDDKGNAEEGRANGEVVVITAVNLQDIQVGVKVGGSTPNFIIGVRIKPNGAIFQNGLRHNQGIAGIGTGPIGN